ncbi:MAG: nucleoside permease [Bacteroidales bacterium]|nr:nucleoside permease [Bacteroidales bacterium]MDD4292888.1 nucleoside permease [Bacteroidales bacterium]
MSTKLRLTLMNFLQFFLWGSWLISLGGYMIVKLNFTGGQVGGIYATMGLASLFMPGLLGVVADRWINAEKLLGICHLIGALLLFWASTVTDPDLMYWIMLLNAMVYMPTIALNNTVSYTILKQKGMDVVKDFPPIRVWGTVGFIMAMWVVDLCGWSLSPLQLYIGSAAAFILGLYAFTMPSCPPAKSQKKRTLISSLGLDAFVLFKQPKIATFFIFAMLLGAALQITNTFGTPFLQEFAKNPAYASLFAVTHPGILMSISQMSETLFILAIPFFLSRFGIKKVVLMSIFAWVLRFGLFGLGNPGDGLVLLVMSMIIYGIAFDFFNISGSLFVETEASPEIRASAQGLFMIMTNGIGAFVGGWVSGWVVDYFTAADGMKDWQSIWFVFATYALILGILFAIFFRYKHVPKAA